MSNKVPFNYILSTLVKFDPFFHTYLTHETIWYSKGRGELSKDDKRWVNLLWYPWIPQSIHQGDMYRLFLISYCCARLLRRLPRRKGRIWFIQLNLSRTNHSSRLLCRLICQAVIRAMQWCVPMVALECKAHKVSINHEYTYQNQCKSTIQGRPWCSSDDDREVSAKKTLILETYWQKKSLL